MYLFVKNPRKGIFYCAPGMHILYRVKVTNPDLAAGAGKIHTLNFISSPDAYNINTFPKRAGAFQNFFEKTRAPCQL
jgi:hypothetical protein